MSHHSPQFGGKDWHLPMVCSWVEKNIQDLSLHFSEKDAFKVLMQQSHFLGIHRGSHSPTELCLVPLRMWGVKKLQGVVSWTLLWLFNSIGFCWLWVDIAKDNQTKVTHSFTTRYEWKRATLQRLLTLMTVTGYTGARPRACGWRDYAVVTRKLQGTVGPIRKEQWYHRVQFLVKQGQ